MVIVNALADHLSERFEWIKGRIMLVVETISSVVTGIWDNFGGELSGIAEGFLKDIENLWEGFKSILGSIVDAIAAAIQGDWVEFGRQMRVATDEWLLLMQTAFSNSKAAFAELISAIGEAIRERWESISWQSIGQFAMDGLKSGILSKVQSIANAARSVAQAAKDAITGFFNIQSPSRLMYEIGEFVVQGFVDALNDGESDIQEAAEKAFDITGKLSSIAGVSERIFKDRVLGRIETGIEGTQEKIGEANRILNHEIEKDRLTSEQQKELSDRRNRTAELERTLEGLQSGRLGSHLSDSGS
jgi:phage-related protein